MNTNYKKIQEFHKKFGITRRWDSKLLTNKERDALKSFICKFDGIFSEFKEAQMESSNSLLLRIRLMAEEALELFEAMLDDNIYQIAKELADKLYVDYGTAEFYSLPIDEVFNAVHESNMTKTPAKDAGGKIQKGPNYQAPNIKELLYRLSFGGT